MPIETKTRNKACPVPIETTKTRDKASPVSLETEDSGILSGRVLRL